MYIRKQQLGELSGGIPYPVMAKYHAMTATQRLKIIAPVSADLFSPDDLSRYYYIFRVNLADHDGAIFDKSRIKIMATATNEITARLIAWMQATNIDAAEHARRYKIYRIWHPVNTAWQGFLLMAASIVAGGLIGTALAPGVAPASSAVAESAAAASAAATGISTTTVITGTLLPDVIVTAGGIGWSGAVAAGIAAAGTSGAGALAQALGPAQGAAGAPLPGVTQLPDLTVTAAADPGLSPGYALWGSRAISAGGLTATDFKPPTEYKNEWQIQKEKLLSSLKKYAIDYGTDQAMAWYQKQLQAKMQADEEKRLREELERARAEWAALQKTGAASSPSVPATGKLAGILLAVALRWAFK